MLDHTTHSTATATTTNYAQDVDYSTSVSTQLGSHRECPDCQGGSAVKQAADGVVFCGDCGRVLSETPIEQSEPKWTPREERRTGPAESVTHESVGTKIGYGANDGGLLSHHNKRLSHPTRSLKIGLREVRSLCTACELSDATVNRAAYLYRKAATAKLPQGRSRDSIAAACVFIAARHYRQPITLDDLAAVSSQSKQRISNDYRTVMQEFELGVQPANPRDFVPKVATAVNVSFAIQRRARELLEELIADNAHVGQSPTGLAAAAVYVAALSGNRAVTQNGVADAAGVGTVTISRQAETIRSYVD